VQSAIITTPVKKHEFTKNLPQSRREHREGELQTTQSTLLLDLVDGSTRDVASTLSQSNSFIKTTTRIPKSASSSEVESQLYAEPMLSIREVRRESARVTTSRGVDRNQGS